MHSRQLPAFFGMIRAIGVHTMLAKIFFGGSQMDTEEKQNTGRANATADIAQDSDSQATTAQAAPSGGHGNSQAGQAPDMMALLEQCAVPSPVCGWLRCLRAPGMELTYSMQKRHIPDMDTEKQQAPGGQAGGKPAKGSNQSPSAESSSTAATGNQADPNGQPGSMQCAGSCRVRYFDLAVGAMVALAVGCMMKCMLGCCRCMKRKWL